MLCCLLSMLSPLDIEHVLFNMANEDGIRLVQNSPFIVLYF